jgi:hypothetical protein
MQILYFCSKQKKVDVMSKKPSALSQIIYAFILYFGMWYAFTTSTALPELITGGFVALVLSIFTYKVTDAGIGDGTIDAVFKTIDRITGQHGLLMDYKVKSVSRGKDALASVTVQVAFNDDEPAVIGHGLSIDTMLASARAYIGALNSYLSMEGKLRYRTDTKTTV